MVGSETSQRNKHVTSPDSLTLVQLRTKLIWNIHLSVLIRCLSPSTHLAFFPSIIAIISLLDDRHSHDNNDNLLT